MTDRQLEVLVAVAEAGSAAGAAKALSIAEQTVKNHLNLVLAATESKTSLQAYHRLLGGKAFRRVTTVTVEYGEDR